MSHTTPIQAGQIKKGMVALLKGRPCKIIETSVSKTGKHGHAKVHFIGIDVFTGKKLEEVSPSTHTMSQPVLSRVEYELVDIDTDNYLFLMDDEGENREDIKLPGGELGKQIKTRFENEEILSLTLLSWVNVEEAIISWKKLSE